jgi:hypothetical protein
MNLKEPIFFGMNVLQLVTALIVGLLVGLIMIGSSTPKTVETPVQIITPVPTPPPVIITQTPVQEVRVNQTVIDTVDLMVSPILFMWNWMPWLTGVFFIWGLIQIMRGFRDNGGEY